jgi:hypothetical protein
VRIFRTGLLFFLPLAPAFLAMSDGGRILICARLTRDLLCLVSCFDPAPIVSRWLCPAIAAMCERQKKQIGGAVFGVAPASPLGHANEAEGFGLTNPWRNGGAVHRVSDKVIGCNW